MSEPIDPQTVEAIRRFERAQAGAIWCDHCDKHVNPGDHNDDCPWPMVATLLRHLAAVEQERDKATRILEIERRYTEKIVPCPDCRDKIEAGDCQRCARQRAEAERDALAAEVQRLRAQQAPDDGPAALMAAAGIDTERDEHGHYKVPSRQPNPADLCWCPYSGCGRN